MADYECFPLWEADGLCNLDPWSLDISSELAAAITGWADAYDMTLNREDPAASGVTDVAAAEAWLLVGAHLAARLRGEGMAVDFIHHDKPARDLVARKQ